MRIFPSNIADADFVMVALQDRGVTARQLSRAIDVSTERAAVMLSTHEARLTVAQAMAVEQLAGADFNTLIQEGLHVHSADNPKRLAELHEMRLAGIFPDIRPDLAKRGRGARLPS